MHFDVLQSISLNGRIDRPNDDRCGSTGHLAWVIDGATDMGPPGLLGTQGGAAWLASTASAAFTGVLARDIEATCAAVFDKIEARFAREKTRDPIAQWEVPKAAFCAAHLQGRKLGVAWAADCPILHATGGSVGWCTGEPDTQAEAADAQALGPGIGATDKLTGAVLEDRRAHRARDGHEALSSQAAASSAATRYNEVSVQPGDELLLMSDGFASLVTDYNVYTADTLITAVRSKGLDHLAQEIRAVEVQDAACLQFPRFKVSDDATALWLRISG